MTYDIAIIGGGISGLTTAYDLQRCGRSVIVLERQQTVGGNAISQRINGFLMEHGPTTLNTLVPQALELTKNLNIENQRLDLSCGVRKRYLRHGGTLHGIGINRAGFLLSPYLSLRGRLRLMTEILRPRKTSNEDESIHAFVCRRFGIEFADKIMAPLVAGIFAGDSHKLSLNSVFPKLMKMEQEFGSVTRGILHARQSSEPGKRLFSFRDGIGILPKTLANAMPGCIKTATAVKSVSNHPQGYRIETHRSGNLTSRAIVFAVQPHVAANLLEPLDEAAATAAAEIDAPPLSVVFLAYARRQVAHPLDSLGFLSVAGTGGIINGAQFPSTMFANRAPDGFISISAYVGGSCNHDAACLNSNDLSHLVHRELSDLLGISGEPVLSRCRQWARSLPQYEIGHSEKVSTIEALHRRLPGLYVTGNYLAGVSVASCIEQARATADKINRFLPDVMQVTPANTGSGFWARA
jgi:protoporphyrinogen/coproporphyrinogen III oxidase